MRKRRPLFWGLYPSYLLLSLALLFVLGWVSSLFLRDLYRELTRASLIQQARLLGEAVQRALLSPEGVAVDRLCKAVGRRSGTRLTVVLPGGRVVGDSDEDPGQMDYHNKRPEILEAMDGKVGVSERYSRTLKQPMMYVALPLASDGQVRAVVRTSTPISQIEEILTQARNRFILIGVLFVLLAAVICRTVAGPLGSRVETLMRGAEAFTENHSAQRLLPAGPAELAAAAEALNRMAAGLGSRIDHLVSQRNEYEAVLSSMVEGVIAIDLDERLLSVNQAAVDILRIDPDRIKGKSILEVVRNSSFQNFVAHALKSGEAVSGDVIMHLEEERIINVQCVALRDSRETRIGSLVVLDDVSQIRRLENVRRDFVANASHEIKTPLTAIKGFVETLAGGAIHQPREAERFLGIIANHVNRLEAILEDLLSLARLEQSAGKSGLVLEQGRMGEIINTAAQVVQARAEKKGIAIEIVEEEEGHAEVDATLMEQALVNLIDNAVKYSPPGSTVRIRSGRLNGGVFISIADQGPGIAKKHQARLFERFYRVDQARSRKLGGTGLGLAIVKHIIEAHGGHVTLESTLGQGSTFTLHLPQKAVVPRT